MGLTMHSHGNNSWCEMAQYFMSHTTKDSTKIFAIPVKCMDQDLAIDLNTFLITGDSKNSGSLTKHHRLDRGMWLPMHQCSEKLEALLHIPQEGGDHFKCCYEWCMGSTNQSPTSQMLGVQCTCTSACTRISKLTPFVENKGNDNPFMYGTRVIFYHPLWGIFQRNQPPYVKTIFKKLTHLLPI
jgi:hypothetical protein